jgi:hypothetical protein
MFAFNCFQIYIIFRQDMNRKKTIWVVKGNVKYINKLPGESQIYLKFATKLNLTSQKTFLGVWVLKCIFLVFNNRIIRPVTGMEVMYFERGRTLDCSIVSRRIRKFRKMRHLSYKKLRTPLIYGTTVFSENKLYGIFFELLI